MASVHAGGKVLVGIRPEHMRWRPAGAPDPSALRGRVELVEQLEPESYIVVSPADPGVVIRLSDDFVREGGSAASDLAQADARVLNLRVGAGSAPRRGDVIDLLPELDHVHLFDAGSGASLYKKAARAA